MIARPTSEEAKKSRCFRGEARRVESSQVESRCRKPEESDWLTYWGSRQSWWIPKTWSPPGKIFKVAPQEQLVDLESRYTSQYHSTSLRARFGELSSDDLRLAACEPVGATRRKIPYCYHSNFLIPTCWECSVMSRGHPRKLPPLEQSSKCKKTENSRSLNGPMSAKKKHFKNAETTNC